MIDEAPREWVAEIFARLTACFGLTAIDAMFATVPAADVQEEWGRGLAGLTSGEISRALEASRTRRFPPNLGEFLQLARPGLDPETAWNEAVDGMREHVAGRVFPWSHPAVFWAAREMQFELRSSAYAAVSKRWSALLARSWAARTWSPVPDPTLKRIAAPAQAEIVPGARTAALERMRKVRDELAEKLSADRFLGSASAELGDGDARLEMAQREQDRIAEYARQNGIPL